MSRGNPHIVVIALFTLLIALNLTAITTSPIAQSASDGTDSHTIIRANGKILVWKFISPELARYRNYYYTLYLYNDSTIIFPALGYEAYDKVIIISYDVENNVLTLENFIMYQEFKYTECSIGNLISDLLADKDKSSLILLAISAAVLPKTLINNFESILLEDKITVKFSYYSEYNREYVVETCNFRISPTIPEFQLDINVNRGEYSGYNAVIATFKPNFDEAAVRELKLIWREDGVLLAVEADGEIVFKLIVEDDLSVKGLEEVAESFAEPVSGSGTTTTTAAATATTTVARATTASTGVAAGSAVTTVTTGISGGEAGVSPSEGGGSAGSSGVGEGGGGGFGSAWLIGAVAAVVLAAGLGFLALRLRR